MDFKKPIPAKRVFATAAKVQRLFKIPPLDEGTGRRNPPTNLGPTRWPTQYRNNQYQTPCTPVRTATKNASKQIATNKIFGSSLLSDLFDADVNAEVGAKI